MKTYKTTEVATMIGIHPNTVFIVPDSAPCKGLK